MIIGVPKEIKKHEYRVSVTPAGVAELSDSGHVILVEPSAGDGSGFSDNEYRQAGAEFIDKERLFKRADLVVKVKEPLPEEYDLLRQGSALFTYLHLAPNPGLTRILLDKKITALAYETLEKNGSLPLLQPMSTIAGSMAPLVGAYFLQKPVGGAGVLPMGMPGVRPAKVVILGAGTVGLHAARVSIGLEMNTVMLNRGIDRLERMQELFPGRITTLPLTPQAIADEIRDADMVIGAVYSLGSRTPVLIKRAMLSTMKRGAIIVDVSIDQGGCSETSRPTSHDNPVYEVDGILHYMVANMPGAYPRTSTLALTNATLPYIRKIAEQGVITAMENNPALKSALNTHQGTITHKNLAKEHLPA